MLTNEKHKDFLLSIKTDLKSIEDLRNCTAHNRTPSNREEERKTS